jgi:hypothetical protein
VPGCRHAGSAGYRQKEELVPETTSRDAELLIADVEDISWEDLVMHMMPGDPDHDGRILTMCSTCGYTCDVRPCDPHCESPLPH